MAAPVFREASRLFALLIGVDRYLPGAVSAGSYPNLNGCVRDVQSVESFLRARLGLSADQIIRLTATNIGRDLPPEPPDSRPTYENMVSAFRTITERAGRGDQVYIHYSGHGGRATSTIPGVNTDADPVDHALVPYDIGDAHARYLRDHELATLIRDMVGKDLFVTMVLDCGFQGEPTLRDFVPYVRGVAVRGVNFIDRTAPSKDSLVASRDELRDTWLRLLGTPRSWTPSNLAFQFLPHQERFTLLAACRGHEVAYEAIVDGPKFQGVLTHWLMDSLSQVDPGSTYRTLFDRVLAKVHSQFERQTPVFQGDPSRVLFSGWVVASNTEAEDDGARSRSTPTVHPGTPDTTTARTVHVVRPDGKPPKTRDAALQSVISAIKELPEVAWVVLADSAGPADFVVTLSADGATFVIADPAGQPIDVHPPIGVDAPDAAATVVRRLVHLTRYRNVLELENADPSSRLRGKLIVDLTGVQDDYDPVERPEPRPMEDAAGIYTLRQGQWTFLRVSNRSADVLNIAVLVLQPDYAITQVFPLSTNLYSEPLDPGAELRLIPLLARLPPGFEEGTAVLKVFATTAAANFRVFELPSLDNRGAHRGFTESRTAADDWAVAQVMVRVKPGRDRVVEPAAVGPETGTPDLFRRYSEFRIEFGEPSGDNAPLRVHPPVGAPIEGRFRLLPNDKALDEILSGITRAALSMAQGGGFLVGLDPVRELGDHLFRRLFDDGTRALYERSLKRAERRGEVLRLRLATDSPRLLAQPWEFLYDGSRSQFVVLALRSPLVQQASATSPLSPPAPVPPPLRVLAVGADITGTLGVADEFALLRDLERESHGNLVLDVIDGATAEAFLRAVRTREYHVIHFSGNAFVEAPGATMRTERSQLILMRPDGRALSPGERASPDQFVGTEALTAALQTRPAVRMVLLNACRTSSLARDLSAVVPAALGMRHDITVKACFALTRGFYRALIDRQPLETAVTIARQEIDLDQPGSREWVMPVFYMQVSDGGLIAGGRGPEGPAEATALRLGRGATARRSTPQQPPPQDRRRRGMEIQLDVYRKNLAELAAIGASYAATPDFVVSQDRNLRSKIEQLERELAELERGPGGTR